MVKGDKDFLFVVFDIHNGGGGERVTANMVNYYLDKGCAAEILSFGKRTEKPIAGLNGKARIHYLSTSSNKFIQKIQTIIRIKSFLKRHQYSYIIGIGSYPSFILGLINHKESVCIGTEHSHFYNAGIVWNYLRRFAYPRLSAIVVLTQHDLPILKAINNKTYVIPNAQTFAPSSYTSYMNHRFLAVGRMDRYKQFGQMIDIFHEFVKRDHSWELVIVGNGELFDNLQEQIKELDLEDKVKIKPYSHHIEQEYLEASVLLSTSRREGLPMVMIEAMSYGLPVIAYDCKTGPSDIIIHRQDGFLIPLDDKEEMLKCMLDIAGDDALRARMSQCAIVDSKRFSPESVYPQWDALFEELAH